MKKFKIIDKKTGEEINDDTFKVLCINQEGDVAVEVSYEAKNGGYEPDSLRQLNNLEVDNLLIKNK